MSIARGSLSLLNYKEETVYGQAPAGNWLSFPVNSETMDESINTVQGEDIRPDRANPSLRGGNIATGGGMVCDYGPVRHLTFMRHLLAGVWSATPVTSNLPAAVDSVAYALGQWVKGTANSFWRCTTAGTAGAGLTAALTGTSPVTSGTAVFTPQKGSAAAADATPYALYDIVTAANNSRWQVVTAGTSGTAVTAALVGTADVVSGTVVFRYMLGDLKSSVNYKRGDLVTNATGQYYTCTRGGTSLSSVTPADLTGIGEVIIPGTGTTLLKFQYMDSSTKALYKHTIIPGQQWPVGGISIEKSVKGGSTNMFVLFRGCRINSLELAVPQEGIVKSTWGILSKDSVKLLATGAGTPVLTGEAPYTGFNAYIGLNETTGNADRSVREFSMTLTNNAAEDTYVIGSRFRAEIPEQIRRASGRLSMYFQDPLEYDYFKQETTVTMDLSFIWNGDMIAFHFGEVKLTGSGTPKIAGQGLMMADFEWTAFLENGVYDVVFTAVNDAPMPPA